MDQITVASLLPTQTPEDTEILQLIQIASKIIGGVTVLIHLWIVASVAFSKKLHSVSDVLLASLAVSDILLGIILISASSAFFNWSAERPVWNLTVFAGSLHFVIVSYFVNSCAVVADRYFKVSRPMKYIRLVTKQTGATIVALIWGLSVGSGILMFALLQDTLSTTTASLERILDDDSFAHTNFIVINITLLPLMTTIACFTIALLHIARKQQCKVKQEMLVLSHLRASTHHSEGNLPNTRFITNQSNSKRKTTVYFISNFSAFVLSLLPMYLTLHITVFAQVDIQVYLPLFGGFSMLAIVQWLLGTVFLAFTQKKHRQVLRGAVKAIKLKLNEGRSFL
ncbi:5-hydroxytryptamine receptor 2C-like [Asterias amurensis]|uniref:5-hydroxytryptamine receptor 2C-like n=1 Tax=Asterias amurensis TaxID=7602 RepID=UPI003AB47504